MKQLTKEQAIKCANSEIWKDMSNNEIVDFQLFQNKLCMPFGVFHKATSEVLNRPVFTHEFANPELLISEYYGEKDKPTFDEIINLIPEHKRIIIEV